MARQFYVAGEVMVYVRGNANVAGMNSLTQLGLSDTSISVSLDYRHRDIMVDAWGNSEIPADVQTFLTAANIQMTLIHFDLTILNQCLMESQGGPTNGTIGTEQRAGTLMGGNVALYAAGNHYMQLYLTNPVGGQPWNFYAAYLTGPPMQFPMGTEKSIVTLNWRAIPYGGVDPYGTSAQGGAAGTGAQGTPLYDHVVQNVP